MAAAPPENFVSIGAQAVDNLLVDILVRDDLHLATFSTGYVTSARSTSAAKAMAARIPSAVSRGCSDKIWSKDSPAASLSRISSTVIRVPASVGLPIMIFGSEMIRACDISTAIHFQFTPWQ